MIASTQAICHLIDGEEESMLRKRIEKLEVTLPVSPGRLLDRLDSRAINSLSSHNRGLVNEMLRASGQRKTWSSEYRLAEECYLESFGLLLREVSDSELAGLITQCERELGHQIPDARAIS
jgi:hypothetical protein